MEQETTVPASEKNDRNDEQPRNALEEVPREIEDAETRSRDTDEQ